MIIFLYIWIVLILLGTIMYFIGSYVENNFDEDSSVKKWWRKHNVRILEDDDYIK